MLLSFLIIASGWWHIRAAYGSDSRQFYISKPLTMLFIIALAFGYQSDDHNGSHAWILLGLCLSLAGDVLLMLPRDRFIQGLAAFFVAHLCYIVGFAQGPLVLKLIDGLLLLLVAGMVFGLLWGRLGEMKIPVFCYMLVIIAMAWVAAGAWHASLTAGSAAALVGALAAVGALFAGVHFLVQDWLAQAFQWTSFIGTREVLIMAPVLVVAALLLALVASGFSLAKYTKV